MYTTNSPEACLHCLVTSDANICVVEDDKQLEKILKVKAQCPKLKAIVQYEGKPDKPGVISVSKRVKISANTERVNLVRRLRGTA
jgi:Long-chain acyl-CoA synthetases (AMP-forming)